MMKKPEFLTACKADLWSHFKSKVCCDGCNVWVHAECENISSRLFKDLENVDYYCPNCKAKSNYELSASEKCQPDVKSLENSGQNVLPEKVAMVCNGMEGTYIPNLHIKLSVTKQRRSWNCGPKRLGQFGMQETKHTLRKFKHNLKSFWM